MSLVGMFQYIFYRLDLTAIFNIYMGVLFLCKVRVVWHDLSIINKISIYYVFSFSRRFCMEQHLFRHRNFPKLLGVLFCTNYSYAWRMGIQLQGQWIILVLTISYNIESRVSSEITSDTFWTIMSESVILSGFTNINSRRMCCNSRLFKFITWI